MIREHVRSGDSRQPVSNRWRSLTRSLMKALPLGLLLAATTPAQAQDTVEWTHLGGNAHHTRYTPANNVTPQNFSELKEAWVWDGASFAAASGRSTPSYVDGKLFTVAGPRRHVIAMDPESGETLWSYREPNTFRWEYSMRQDYGKGVAYAEVDGKGVVYIISPAFFLTALDADTGAPLPGFGAPVPIDGFPQTGVIDLLAHMGHDYDPYYGIPKEVGYVTSSSPPIVVNGVVVVGNSAEQGYNQSRIENIPGDILAFDAKTGDFKWKFNVIPRPGEFGHDTWENDAWQYTGDVSPWAPLSADPELGLVYVPTNPPTVDYYGGFSPGDNLFGTSLIALDVETGERRWHFQFVHHDIWNYDVPTAPVLLDVTINGERIPAVAQATKQSILFAFNRETGEPLWPIEERPVPESHVPGEFASPTQPFPTKPLPYDLNGLTEDDLIDFTPEMRAQAIAALEDWQIGPLYNPPLHRDNDLGKRGAFWCPGGGGGSNITGPAAGDPETGIVFVTSQSACSAIQLLPGEEADLRYMTDNGTTTTGVTPARYANGPGAGAPRHPTGLPLWKPPYSRITAIDLNTGEHLWMIPVGETPDRIRNNPALAGIDVGNTGTGAMAPMMVTPSMLVYAGEVSDGTPHLFAIEKTTGRELARVPVSASSRYGMMSYVHKGEQYIILLTGSKLTAMSLHGPRASAAAH
ncbi:MAG: PQQ-binding-like beta-propeller repeat protein [Gammaproteobacteria bacterium]|nr:PQQ-binding-like beta-propeller repeat protein [Gammaproteobacteria bacterium]